MWPPPGEPTYNRWPCFWLLCLWWMVMTSQRLIVVIFNFHFHIRYRTQISDALRFASCRRPCTQGEGDSWTGDCGQLFKAKVSTALRRYNRPDQAFHLIQHRWSSSSVDATKRRQSDQFILNSCYTNRKPVLRRNVTSSAPPPALQMLYGASYDKVLKVNGRCLLKNKNILDLWEKTRLNSPQARGSGLSRRSAKCADWYSEDRTL